MDITNLTRNPETSAALQMLYHGADSATAQGRTLAFRAIARLSGQSVTAIEKTWKATR